MKDLEFVGMFPFQRTAMTSSWNRLWWLMTQDFLDLRYAKRIMFYLMSKILPSLCCYPAEQQKVLAIRMWYPSSTILKPGHGLGKILAGCLCDLIGGRWFGLYPPSGCCPCLCSLPTPSSSLAPPASFTSLGLAPPLAVHSAKQSRRFCDIYLKFWVYGEKNGGRHQDFFFAIDYSRPHVAASGNVPDAGTSRILKWSRCQSIKTYFSPSDCDG